MTDPGSAGVDKGFKSRTESVHCSSNTSHHITIDPTFFNEISIVRRKDYLNDQFQSLNPSRPASLTKIENMRNRVHRHHLLAQLFLHMILLQIDT